MLRIGSSDGDGWSANKNDCLLVGVMGSLSKLFSLAIFYPENKFRIDFLMTRFLVQNCTDTFNRARRSHVAAKKTTESKKH